MGGEVTGGGGGRSSPSGRGRLRSFWTWLEGGDGSGRFLILSNWLGDIVACLGDLTVAGGESVAGPGGELVGGGPVGVVGPLAGVEAVPGVGSGVTAGRSDMSPSLTDDRSAGGW